MTWASTRAISSPDGRLPGLNSDRIAYRARLEDVDRLEASAPRVGLEQRQLLLAVHQVVGVVDVEHDRCRQAGVAEQNRSMKPVPIRYSVRVSARFSRREMVGWLGMLRPVSGARSHAIMRAGSSRSASRSSASS